jgi:S1-C subfamily serine protease
MLPKKFFLFLVLVLFLISACAVRNAPYKDTIPASYRDLPIDGLWRNEVFRDAFARVERSMMYWDSDYDVYRAGMVIAKDIVQISPRKYSCSISLLYMPYKQFVGFVSGEIEVLTESRIVVRFGPDPRLVDPRLYDVYLEKVALVDESLYLSLLKEDVSQPSATIKESIQKQEADTTPELVEKLSFGTAWPTSSGYVVTSYHVVRNSVEIILIRPDGVETSATIAVRDVANDIALLRPSDLQHLPPALPLATNPVGMGATVFTIGYPHPDLMGARSKLTDGITSAVFGMGDDPRMYQVSVPLHKGNSGGPLLNTKGEVVGVVTEKLNALKMLRVTGELPQDVSYAVKSEYVKVLLDLAPELDKHRALSTQKGSLEKLAVRIKPSVLMVLAKVLEKPDMTRPKEQRRAELWDGTWIGKAASTSATGQAPGSRRWVRCGEAALQMHIKDSTITGTAVDSHQISYQISGSVDRDGKVRIGIAKGGRNAANIEGSLSEGSGGGIWRDVYGCFGTWSVKKQ